MKKFLKSIFLWAFIIVISITFIAYFGMTGDSLTGSQEVGTVNGSPILNKRVSAFSESYNSIQDLYQEQGYQIDNQIAQAISQEAFRQAVILNLLWKFATKNKIYVSDYDIVNNIKQIYFNDDSVEFKNFRKTGEQLVQREIEELTRHKIIKQYHEDLLRNIPYSKLELEEKIKISSIERKVLVASIQIDSKLEEYATEKILKKYFQDNISRYQETTNQATETTNQITYSEVKDDVKTDYYLENKDNLIDSIRNDISFKFKSLSSNQYTAKEFQKTTKSLGMLISKSVPFNFFSKNIFDENNTTLINDESIIKNLFSIKIKFPSDIFQQDNSFLVVFIVEENIQKDISGFVKNRYINEVKNQNTRNLLLSLYNSLYENAEVVINQQPQQN